MKASFLRDFPQNWGLAVTPARAAQSGPGNCAATRRHPAAAHPPPTASPAVSQPVNHIRPSDINQPELLGRKNKKGF